MPWSHRWRKAGIWQRILSDLQAEAPPRGEIDWDLHFVDATIVRAHQPAGGARRDGATPEEAQVREALGAAKAGSRPSCICAPRAMGGRSPWC